MNELLLDYLPLVIFIAVAAGCYWMYLNYLAAPRQP